MTRFRAERIGNGPIIHSGLAESIGRNINGPSAIRVPGWVTDPFGRYYLYFADHRGDHIRLAYADDIAGPWRIYTPGTLCLADSGFPTNPNELDPPPDLQQAVATGDLRPHIASPDVHVDNAARQIVMHFHGLTRNCSQITCRAVSADGLEFRKITPTGADFYARVFSWRGATYAAALEGWLYRSPDGGLTFPERGPFRGSINPPCRRFRSRPSTQPGLFPHWGLTRAPLVEPGSGGRPLAIVESIGTRRTPASAFRLGRGRPAGGPFETGSG